MKKISITVDTNDADYVTSVSNIDDTALAQLIPVFAAIKAFKSYVGTRDDWKHPHRSNWPTGQCYRDDLGEKLPLDIYPQLTEDQINLFDDFCPRCDEGFHTVDAVEVFEIVSETKYI